MQPHDTSPGSRTDPLIARLADDLRPVRAQRARTGWTWLLLAALATGVGVQLAFGLKPGQALQPEGRWFLLGEALLATLGIACAAAVIRMAAPQRTGRPVACWVALASALMPAAALMLWALGSPLAGTPWAPGHGMCAALGTVSGALVAAALVFWWRRGAPASPARAGLYAGLASGALGSALYGLSCPQPGFAHWALWHFVPVLVLGLAGYVLLPRFLRW